MNEPDRDRRLEERAVTGDVGPAAAKKWLPAVAATGLLGIVVLGGVALGGGDSGSSVPDVTTSLLADIPAETVVAVQEIDESVPIVKTPLDRTLGTGVTGDDVKAVQQRLTDLGFWPGPIDGVYGDETIRSVWAYEKLVLGVASDEPTGQVTPEMWDAMQDPFVIAPRRTTSTPNHVEVYLPEQVVAIFHGNAPVMITHVSSGSNEEWCDEVTISPGEFGNERGLEALVRGECGISNTPGGVFSVDREVAGIRQSALGGMYDPVYFNYGIAIHGALNVPLHPASHGCIRIPLALSPTMQELIGIGDQVFVFDGVQEPEAYGEQPPTFNWIDENYVTTTTSTTSTTTTTTTTVAPTTVAPTTVAPTTVAPLPATTVAPVPPTTIPGG